MLLGPKMWPSDLEMMAIHNCKQPHLILLNIITGCAQQISVCLREIGQLESTSIRGSHYERGKRIHLYLTANLIPSRSPQGTVASRSLSSGAPDWALLQTSEEEENKHPSSTGPDVFWRWNKVPTVPQREEGSHNTRPKCGVTSFHRVFTIITSLNQEAFPHPRWSYETRWVSSALDVLTFTSRALKHSHYVPGISAERVAGRTLHSRISPMASTEMMYVEKCLSGSIWCIFRFSFEAI